MNYRQPVLISLLMASSFSARASNVIVSEVMYNPSGTKAEWIEVTNTTTNRIDMAAWQLSEGASLTLPDFNAGNANAAFLLERERIILSSKTPAETLADYPYMGGTRVFGPWTGALDNAGEEIAILDKNGARLSEFAYGDGGRKWPAAPDGTGHSLVVINENHTLDDWHNWKTSPAQGGTPGTADVVPSEDPISDPTASLSSSYSEVVPMTATWNYYRELSPAPAADWNSRTFVPSLPWASGPALLGFETAALPAPGLQTPFAGSALLTYYFRTTFNWTGGTGGAQFQIDSILDDGATFFLNGTYIGNKDGVPSPVHNSSVATVTTGDATLATNAVTGSIPAGLLVDGPNVLAAVSFQVNTTSSDMVFGANLRLSNLPPNTIFINEVRQGAAGVGFIEFYNTAASAVDLMGYHLTDTSGQWTKFPITQSIVVPPGGLATMGFAEAGFSPTAPTTSIYLSSAAGTPLTGLTAGLPQNGRSIGRKPVGGASWFRFSQPTPGQPNSSTDTGGGSSSVPAFNEVHFNSTTGKADWVEFTNLGATAIPMGGLFVASDKAFADKVALTGTLAGGGYASVDVDFATDGSGDLVLYLIDTNNKVLGEAEVVRRDGKSSSQAWPAGSGEWYASTASTRDAVNAPDRNADVVISEIMYAPPSSHRQGEFVELYNRGTGPANVGGWVFDSGISYVIPSGTTIPAGGRLVVAQNAAYITANYGAVNVVGNYGGSLGNGGDLVRLLDATGNLADEVDYHTEGDWPRGTDGQGYSLELIHPGMNNDSASAWAASNETAKGQWQTFTHTAVYYGQGQLVTPEIHFNMTAEGHVVLRNIRYGVTGAAANTLSAAMSPANSGVDGWRATGTHWATFSDPEGLHIVASGAGDLKGNAIELDVPQAANTSYTITFEARWVRGNNRLVLNSQDHTWGRTFGVPIPNNLGTPGAANSRAAAAAAPEIWSMLHSPAVPRASEDVKITARVSSSIPLASVSVVHRLDAPPPAIGQPYVENTWNTTAMNDAGTGGDATAGDGIYTATLSTYRTEAAIAQFYIQAVATGGGTTNFPPAGPAAPGLWIVDSTPVVSDLMVRRYVMTQKNHFALNNSAGVSATFNFRFPRMSNHYWNSTLITNEKEVTYNVETRKSGSPWTRQGGNGMDRIRSKFPKDRMFRGREKTGADNDAESGGARRMNNDVERYWLYLLGYPAAETEFIQVQFNNLGLALKQDTEPTDTDMLDRTYPDSGDSYLHEVDDAWYFSDDLAGENRGSISGDWVVNANYFENPTYWHASWPMRTQVDTYDFSPLTTWIRTMYNNNVTPAAGTADDAYRAKVEQVFDVDMFARYAAIKGWAGAWDNFTLNRGKNGYVYRRPTDGRWEFHFWDGDLDFQNTGEAVLNGQAGTAPFFGRPWFRRQLNYYLQEIRDKWSLNSPRVYAWLQAREDQSPSFTVDQNYYKTNWFPNRRPTIDGFIGAANQNAAFTATASVGATTTLSLTNITGSAPAGVFTVTVDAQPQAVFKWLTQTNWQMTGVYLREGANSFTVRGWDRQGIAAGTATVNVTKTGNAPPVLVIVSDPTSRNASIGEAVVVDSTGSIDPEGTPLSFSWAVSPLTGVTNTASGATGRRLMFTIPGIYTVTLTGTDGAGNSANLSRELSIYASSDFDSFGSGLVLGSGLTATNTEARDNNSPNSWYSLEDVSGRLQLQLTDTAAAPLDSGNFPQITRPLPSSADWVLQTDTRLDTRHLGEFFNSGLMLDMVEGGQAVRYVYSLETGNQVKVRRDNANTTFYGPGGGSSTPTPILINCGGGQVTETDLKVWQADNYSLASPATAVISQAFNPTVGGSSQHFGRIGGSRRNGVASGGLIYEIPVDSWASNYSVTLYSSVVNATTLTISMNVNVNDAATSTAWTANSSPTIMRQLTLSNVSRNANGKIRLNITRNAATSAGAEAGLSGINITPFIPSTGGGLPALTPAPMPADSMRIQRSGNSLIFSRFVDGKWVVDQTLPVAAGSSAVKGGIFASTETPMNLRATFDYLLVADPTKAASMLANLRLTEVMYNPASDSVEYLEFLNTGITPLDLTGVTLPATTPFSAYSFVAETLSPGEFIVLTGDPAGFRNKYGAAPRLAVTPWASGSLNNAGERVVVTDSNGNPLHDFTYYDAAPWPVAADGQGPSLEVIDVKGDYNNPLNWRASASPAGTPGGTTLPTDPDTDGDGTPDWVETAFGLSIDSPGQQPAATSSTAGSVVTISWPFALGRSYRVERSTNLVSWDSVAVVTGGFYVDSDSSTRFRVFYRIVALP